MLSPITATAPQANRIHISQVPMQNTYLLLVSVKYPASHTVDLVHFQE